MTVNSLIANLIRKNIGKYLTSMLCTMGVSFLFTSFAVILFHPYLLVVEGGPTLHSVISVCMVFSVLYSYVLIFNAVKMETTKKSRSYGIMIQNGADQKIIRDFIFKEYMRTGIVSTVVGIGLAMLMSPLNLKFIRSVINFERFRMYLPYKAVILSLVIYFALIFIISKFAHVFTTNKKIRELIRPRAHLNSSTVKNVLFYMIGIGSSIAFLLMIYSYHSQAIFSGITKGNYTKLVIIPLFAIALYFLIYLVYRQFVIRYIKSERFSKGLGMVIFSDLRTFLKRDTNVIYIMSIILCSVFLFTTVLYSQQREVEHKIHEKYVYSYFYTHARYSVREGDKAHFIENELSGKKGYKSYSGLIFQDERNLGIGFMSYANYYSYALIAKNKITEMNSDEILFIYGSTSENFRKADADKKLKKFLSDNKIEGYKVKKVDVPITPQGLYDGIVVMGATSFKNFDKQKMVPRVANAYYVDDWDSDFRTAYKISDEVTDGHTNKTGFYCAGLEYQEESIVKNLLLYIGLALSFSLIVASELILYFNMMAKLNEDGIKYTTLYTHGYSLAAMRTIVFVKNFIIMYIPYIISGIFLLVSIIKYGDAWSGFYDDAVLNILVMFFCIYTAGYLIISLIYFSHIKKLIRR